MNNYGWSLPPSVTEADVAEATGANQPEYIESFGQTSDCPEMTVSLRQILANDEVAEYCEKLAEWAFQSGMSEVLKNYEECGYLAELETSS